MKDFKLDTTAALLRDKLGLAVVCEPEPDKKVTGAYAGDLLSWVMGRAPADCAWMTVMTNANVVAVATLADVGCVIFTDGAEPDHDAVIKASSRGVNLYATDKDTFTVCSALAECGE